MDVPTRQALKLMRKCLASDRVRVLPHFAQRMDERGLVWSDVLAVFDDPSEVRGDGADDWGRSRWIVKGNAAGHGTLGIVCVLGHDSSGELTVFITLFWEK